MSEKKGTQEAADDQPLVQWVRWTLSGLIAAIARLGATVTGGFHDHGEAARMEEAAAGAEDEAPF